MVCLECYALPLLGLAATFLFSKAQACCGRKAGGKEEGKQVEADAASTDSSAAAAPAGTGHWAEKALGPTLLVRAGKGATEARPTAEVLAGKRRVLLYHSAHWCPPCRSFTPLFATVYEDAVEAGSEDVAVVFVSLDNSKAHFEEYYGSMPWAAVPYEHAGRSRISPAYGVSGIPAVTVLDGATGKVLESNARGTIAAKKSLAGL